jgi:hypothetical protein
MLGLLTLLSLAPAHPALAGIVTTTGAISHVSPPSSVERGRLQSDDEMGIFIERAGHLTTSTLLVNASESGIYDETADLTPALVPSGAIVDSYFLHFDPASAVVELEGTVRFDTPIVGLMVLDSAIRESDSELGAPTVSYSSARDRGLELDKNPDQFEISSDFLVLNVSLQASNVVDQVRIVTLSRVFITFESTPGAGLHGEALTISDQFLNTEDVSFPTEDGGFPAPAQVGSPLPTFQGMPNDTGDNDPDGCRCFGSFSLTDDAVLHARSARRAKPYVGVRGAPTSGEARRQANADRLRVAHGLDGVAL